MTDPSTGVYFFLSSYPYQSMASSVPIPATIHNPLLRRASLLRRVSKYSSLWWSRPRAPTAITVAKFDLAELLGGRGLCNGEEGLEKELKRPLGSPPKTPQEPLQPPSPPSSSSSSFGMGEGAFEKELLGLTGGFPGGEKGVREFIEQNPPPRRMESKSGAAEEEEQVLPGSKKPQPRPPELPLLLPGMIVIVKNPKHPFHMYCGIVQRVTDGKAGVLFEGGNWDKLLTFRLDELERREKGPPMVNPKSAVLESIVQDSG